MCKLQECVKKCAQCLLNKEVANHIISTSRCKHKNMLNIETMLLCVTLYNKQLKKSLFGGLEAILRYISIVGTIPSIACSNI